MKSRELNAPAQQIGKFLPAGLASIAIVLWLAACAPAPATVTPAPPATTAAPITPTGIVQAQTVTTPPVVTPAATGPLDVLQFTLPQGLGARHSFWQVLFTAPTGSRDPSTYFGGVDTYIADTLAGVQRTLDIVAYEFNSPALTQAVLDAKARGIRVRVVTDNEAGLNDDRTTLNQLVAAGIPVVTDERSALMHNKFMILDGEIVVTGSWNFTINDTYRNNNNVLILRSQAVVTGYQAEFDEMFIEGRFGPTSPANTVRPSFTQDGIPVQLYFGPEDDPMDAMIEAVANAQDNIRFMTFSFTHDGLTDALLNRASGGLDIAGIFETTGSMTQYAALPPLACAGIAVRQDGNPFVLHHKVFIIDNTTVVTGSFNFSANATNSNDENMVIISDPALASQYLAEWTRRWNEGRAPALTCS